MWTHGRVAAAFAVGILIKYQMILTVSVALLQLVSQPQDRLGSHLGAKIPVEGSGGSTLVVSKERERWLERCISI